MIKYFMPNLKAIIVFMGIVGSIASVCAILTRDPALCLKMTSLGSLVTLAIWALVKMLEWRREERLKDQDQVPKPDSPPEPKRPIYSFLPALPEDLKWIADLEKSVYKRDAIPEAKLREWYRANGSGFFLILENERRIGHLDILPMKIGDETFEEFCSGGKREVDIPGTSIASPTQKHNIQHLYVESVIIRQAINQQAALRLLLDQFIKLIGKVAEIEKVEHLYALAATKAGQDLLEHLGFEVETRSEQRKDKHPLYRVRLWLMAKRIKRFIRKLSSVDDEKVLEKLLQRAAKSGL